MKKYIFIDVDGTLMNSKNQMTDSVKKSLTKAKKNGYEVILCTGRSIQYSKFLPKECDVSPWIILCSGAQIYDSVEEKFIYQTGIPIETVDKFYELAQKLQLDVNYTVGNHNYSNTLEEGDTLLTKENYFLLKKQLVSRCALSSQSFSNIMKAKREIENWKVVSIANASSDIIQEKEFSYRRKSFLEIVNLNTSKGSAILKVLDLKKSHDSYTYAIGNSINDRSMFQIADCSIAMENSDNLTKQEADWVTKSNDQDGVSYAIEWILNRKIEKEIKKN